jgi:hypothetical protein
MLIYDVDPGSGTTSMETTTIVQFLSDQRMAFSWYGAKRQEDKKREDMLSDWYHTACSL